MAHNEVVLPRYGPPEVFADHDAGPRVPGRGEVVVDTRAAGVNFADIMQRLGFYASAPKPPYVPGFEVAGTVSQVGEGVAAVAPGDRVVALVRQGGYADQVLAPESQVFPLPGEISFEDAAALPVNWLTAWFALFTMGNLRDDEVVLVHGGAGGVGTAAVQLAGEHGATVVATAGSVRKLEFLRGQGVSLALDYRDERWHEQIREALGDHKVDLILDPVGGKTMKRGYELLAPLGRLVCYGLSSAVTGPRKNWLSAARAWFATPRFNPLEMTTDNTGVWGFHLAHLQGKEHRVREAMLGILERVSDGRVAPVVDSRFPLSADGVRRAHHHIHERGNIGKVLLTSEPRRR